MFGKVGDIIKGHYKELTNQENDLYEKRIAICRKCPLYTVSESLGEICDGKKCWNSKLNSIESFPSPETTCGCGCRLKAKTRLANAKCVLNRW